MEGFCCFLHMHRSHGSATAINLSMLFNNEPSMIKRLCILSLFNSLWTFSKGLLLTKSLRTTISFSIWFPVVDFISKFVYSICIHNFTIYLIFTTIIFNLGNNFHIKIFISHRRDRKDVIFQEVRFVICVDYILCNCKVLPAFTACNSVEVLFVVSLSVLNFWGML